MLYLLVILLIIIVIIIVLAIIVTKKNRKADRMCFTSMEYTPDITQKLLSGTTDTKINVYHKLLEPPGDKVDAYVEYDGIIYDFRLNGNRIYKLTHNQYLKNDSYKYSILNKDIVLIVISKKNTEAKFRDGITDLSCSSNSIGQRHINIFEYSSSRTNTTRSLFKNESCFKNGGIEPEYFLIVPVNRYLSEYKCSIHYTPTRDENKIVRFFERFAVKDMKW